MYSSLSLNTVRGGDQIESTLRSSVELLSAVQIGFTDFCVKKYLWFSIEGSIV